MTTEHSFFHRLPTRRMWFQGSGWLLTAWSVLAALALTASLGVLFFILDLLTYQGRIEIAPADTDQLAPFMTHVNRKGIAEDTGIRSTLWRHRECAVVTWVRSPLCRFIPLRTNRGTLATLVVVLILVIVLRAWSLHRMRYRAANLAQETTTSLRSQIHRQILRLGPGDLDQRDYAAAQKLFMQSVEAIASAITTILSYGMYQVAGMVLVLLLMLAIDWSITLQALLPLVAGFYFIRWEWSQGAEMQQLAEARAASDLRILSEGLRKSRIVRGFGMEAIEPRQAVNRRGTDHSVCVEEAATDGHPNSAFSLDVNRVDRRTHTHCPIKVGRKLLTQRRHASFGIDMKHRSGLRLRVAIADGYGSPGHTSSTTQKYGTSSARGDLVTDGRR